MAGVSELLSIYETTEDLVEAEAALDRIAAMERPADLEFGECYDGSAEAAAAADSHSRCERNVGRSSTAAGCPTWRGTCWAGTC